MEVNKVQELIQALGIMTENKNESFLKSLVKNKYLIGSAVVASGVAVVNVAKNISVSNLASTLLPKQLLNVSLMGIPMGGMLGKLLGVTITGTILVEAIKVVMEIRKGESSIAQILVREGVTVIVALFVFLILGNLGLDLLNTANGLAIPAF